MKQSLREVADAGNETHREHAAAVIRLLQAPQRKLQLSVASLPEVHQRTAMMKRRLCEALLPGSNEWECML